MRNEKMLKLLKDAVKKCIEKLLKRKEDVCATHTVFLCEHSKFEYGEKI